METPPLAPGLLHTPACGETVRTTCHIEQQISPIRPHSFARHDSLLSVYTNGVWFGLADGGSVQQKHLWPIR